MGGVSLLSQTNLETHDQIWSSFLNQDAIAEASEVEYESVCDDLSLNSEELYEEVTSESSESDVYNNNSSFDTVLSITNDSYLELENDFTDLLRYEYKNDYILEVQHPTERKRSISHTDIPSHFSSSKKSKTEQTQTISQEDDFIIESDEESLSRNGNIQTTEEKLTKMISQLDPLHLQRAIEIMSDSQSFTGEMRFDLSKMNQSKLLKLYDFVSKCHSNEIIDVDDDDECWSTSTTTKNCSKNQKSFIKNEITMLSPVSSPLPTRPNTPSPVSTPSNRILSPAPVSSKAIPSAFSQNKVMEERLKGLVNSDNKKLKPVSKRSKKDEDDEIDILG